MLQEEEEQEVLQHKGAPGQRSQGQDVEEQRAMARKRLSNNPAARTAALTAFGLAHRLGDHMRDGENALLLNVERAKYYLPFYPINPVFISSARPINSRWMV